MNARFERFEARLEQKADKKSVDKLGETLSHGLARMDARMDLVHASLLGEIGKVNERLADEAVWGRREIRSRLERCERDIEELKGRKGS